MTLFTSTIRRGSPDYLNPRLNCHSKLHEVQALVQALAAGADEALMLDVRGFVSTCNATNFFIVKDGEVITSTGAYCMNGITRHNVIHLCATHGIPATKRTSRSSMYTPLTKHSLPAASAVSPGYENRRSRHRSRRWPSNYSPSTTLQKPSQ